MRVTLLAIAFVLGGCTVQSQYVDADRLTYEAVAPEYLGYVESDPYMSPEETDRRRATVASWKARIGAGGE